MILSDVIGRSHTANMAFSNKGNGEDQIDGNMGVLMGTAQFFLQSRRDEIHLLPALPTKLASGSVSGLRAKDGFEVDLVWNEGELTSGTIHSNLGRTARVRSAWPLNVYAGGDAVAVTTVDTDLYEFPTEAGMTYTLTVGDAEFWAGYVVDDQGRVDSGDLFGALYISESPWVWSYLVSRWIYLPEAHVSAKGAWTWFAKSGPAPDANDTASGEWAGYAVGAGGRTDTGGFLGSLYVASAPWVWNYEANAWMYLPEGHVTDNGAWAYLPIYDR